MTKEEYTNYSSKIYILWKMLFVASHTNYKWVNEKMLIASLFAEYKWMGEKIIWGGSNLLGPLLLYLGV